VSTAKNQNLNIVGGASDNNSTIAGQSTGQFQARPINNVSSVPGIQNEKQARNDVPSGAQSQENNLTLAHKNSVGAATNNTQLLGKDDLISKI
jgi:hypothetical protein